MPNVPRPQNEAPRLKALADYAILDTAAEPMFDDIVAVASHVCGTPIALITLVDAERQWIKARTGLEVSETTRDAAFCAHAILSHTPLIVPDALKDRRFAANPFVTGEPHIRFYAGAPLVTRTGEAVGTLCVLDRVPRSLSAGQVSALEALSRQVLALLEYRRVSGQLAAALDAARTLGGLVPICSHCKRIRDDQSYWEHVDVYLGNQLGTSFTHGICPICEGVLYPE